jgi:uncharacterized damage-inducible protein DinB
MRLRTGRLPKGFTIAPYVRIFVASNFIIIIFCNELWSEDINHTLTYVSFKNEEYSKRLGYLALHVVLHQVHHRVQVTTLLSQEGINFGETDLPEIVPDGKQALVKH